MTEIPGQQVPTGFQSGVAPDMMDGCIGAIRWNPMTSFMRWGRDRGAARALDGLGMLVQQAAEAFHLWHGVWPETKPVIVALRG